MISFIVSLFAVTGLSALLCAIDARDQYSDEISRSLLFSRFRSERRAAKIGYLLLSLLTLLAGSMGLLVPGLLSQILAIALAIYLGAGCIRVLIQVDALAYQQRNRDPALQGIALAVTWPIWR